MLKKIWGKKLVRFACVGIFNTLFDLTILNLLVFFAHVPTLIANLFSATISIVVSYFLNHHIVFRRTEPHEIKSFLKFFAVTGLSIVLVQDSIIFVVTHLLNHDSGLITSIDHTLGTTKLTQKFVNLNFAKMLAVLGGMVWNFVLYRLVVFKDTDEADQFVADA